ncbi:MAG: AAA family ATPase [Magnetococcales bacterium]|nr:AAA family ATPase [Magnetococcales bacterium]
MIVRSLKMQNYRGIDELHINFDQRINVFVGINGSGKSSILSCLAKMLSSVIYPVYTKKRQGIPFSEFDIRNGAEKLDVEIAIGSDEGNLYSWKRALVRNGPKTTETPELKEYIKFVNTCIEKDESFPIPVIVFYSVGRAVLDIPQRIRNRHSFDTRYSGFESSIQGSGDFRLFFEWFREREAYVNGMILDGKQDVTDHQFSSVCAAITALTNFENLRIRRFPQRMILEKYGETLDLDQLSDGEKCLMAMVGDMAMRLSIANPSHQDPLKAQAVFLIDEVDLHLHPEWQRMVLPKLLEVFPNSQFIVSTHSTQILTHIKPENIFRIKRSGSGIVMNHPADSYGQTQDSLYNDIMEVPIRPDCVQKQFRNLYDAIDRKDLKQAKETLDALSSAIGDDAELVKAEIQIKRRGLGR